MSLVFFKQAMHGDILKYNTESSISDAGGGARDLRVSVELEPALRALLPNATSVAGVTHGVVTWNTPHGVQHVDVELRPPNDARENEIRIARFYTVGGWEIDENQFLADRAAHLRTFYILEQIGNGDVVARTIAQARLAHEPPAFANYVSSLFGIGNPNHAIRGAIDLATGTTF